MTPRYRRLPGTRRGIVNGASTWMGADHILLVKSMRFREEYKRFHLRDVQAIAVAKAPRFHISTRAIAIGAVWLAALVASNGMTVLGRPSLAPYLWILALVLVAAWFYVSAFSSCRCRIYTAVSSDELPSVYRTWTARKFLAAVEPKIGEVQGVLEGEWAEAAESRDIGPPLQHPAGAGVGMLPSGQPAPVHSLPAHTLLADIFIAVLLASGLFAFLMLNASPAAVRSVAIAFMVLKVGLGVAIFVQHYKGQLASGMQKVAIAALLVMGVMYYLEQLSAGFAGAAAAAANKQNPMAQITPVLASGNRLATELNGGASLLLGCLGLGIIVMARESRVS